MTTQREKNKQIYIYIYKITWLLWAFSLVVDRDQLKDTHRWRQNHVRLRQQTCFSFFMPQKSFNKPFDFLLYKTMWFLLYKTNRQHLSVFVYCTRSQKTSQRVNTCCDVVGDLLQYTHTGNVIYMLNINTLWNKMTKQVQWFCFWRNSFKFVPLYGWMSDRKHEWVTARMNNHQRRITHRVEWPPGLNDP